MTSAEVSNWMLYEAQVEPLSQDRWEIMLANLTATVANAFRGKKSRAIKPKEFLPQWTRKRMRPSNDLSFAKMKILAQVHNKRLENAKHGRHR